MSGNHRMAVSQRRRRYAVMAIAVACAVVVVSIAVLSSIAVGMQRQASTAASPPVASRTSNQPVTAGAARGEFVDLWGSGGFKANDLAAMKDAATRNGAQWLVVARATVEMSQITRAGVVVRSSQPAMFFPMDSIAVSPSKAAGTMGAAVADALTRGEIVMSRTSASVQGAKVGDRVDLRAWGRSRHQFTVGFVAEDASVLGAELVMDDSTGTTMGITRPSRVRLSGTQKQLEAAVAALVKPARVDRSWSPLTPSGAISQAETKQLLGQFSYTRRASGTISVDSAWRKANLVTTKLPLIGSIPCHRVVAAAATAALTEIERQGLGALINTRDTFRNGGCWGPREQRSSFGTIGRTLSRHSWGAAVDINPTANPYGAYPTIDPRIIAIFRQHGFMWGGDFPTPDGMHFEYIGT
jgi:hypothetical protein